jgi:hypothetical protein
MPALILIDIARHWSRGSRLAAFLFRPRQCTHSILGQYHPQLALTTRPEAESVSRVTRSGL